MEGSFYCKPMYENTIAFTVNVLLSCYLVVGSNECISLVFTVVFFEKIINTNFLLHTSRSNVINETNKRTGRLCFAFFRRVAKWGFERVSLFNTDT